jgi:hypothetical protein
LHFTIGVMTWKVQVTREDYDGRLHGHLYAVSKDHMWSVGEKLVESGFAFSLATDGKLFDVKLFLE